MQTRHTRSGATIAALAFLAGLLTLMGARDGHASLAFCNITDPTSCIDTDGFDCAPGVPCLDTDGNACTHAACDGAATCEQNHSVTPCPPDPNECTDDLCNTLTGLCEHPPKSDSTPCTDTDLNACTTAGCNGAGTCDQNHQTNVCTPDGIECTDDPPCNTQTGLCDHPFSSDSTPCSDTDQNPCTTAGCDGAGTCAQDHVVRDCSAECNTGQCDSSTGLCVLSPDSTPCADSDDNDCTSAGCDGFGNCDQIHLFQPDSTPCVDSDDNACTTPGCDGAGTCDQNHITRVCVQSTCNTGQCDSSTGLCVPEAAGTPCPDTDGNVCTGAGCESAGELGACNQSHVLLTSTTHCADTDGNECTTAACNGAGACNQTQVVTNCPPDSLECTNDPGCNSQTGACEHPPKTADTLCTDTDGNACTTAACNGTGSCVQNQMVTVCTSDGIECTDDPPCNTQNGLCSHPPKADSTPCTDTDTLGCTTAGCDGAGHCVQDHIDECQKIPCRVTAGGWIGGETVLSTSADISKGNFGGQVGAPCGCIGCFPNFTQIQGNWQYSRKTKLGNFHAMLYNSLACGCEDLSNNTVALDGVLCGNRIIGPTPPAAPANIACFTGQGQLSPLSVGKRTQVVAFRVDVEDRGEPGAGSNSGPSADRYRIRIWKPTGTETIASLTAAACCDNPDRNLANLRAADVDDSGAVQHGNIQIHEAVGGQGTCPPPPTSGTCAAP